MQSTKTLMKPLLELGLNNYEAKVYLTLVSEGTSTAKNISDSTGIPYGKVYEVVNSLASKGFCVILPIKPMKYKAMSPKEALKKVKKTTIEKIDKLETSIINHIEPLFEESKAFAEQKSVFWIINGRKNTIKMIGELINKAQKNILIHTTEQGLKRLVIHKKELQEAQEKGVDIKIAGTITDENRKEIMSLSTICDIRHINKASTNYITVDSKESIAIEAIPDDEDIVFGRDIGIWASNHSFTQLLEDSFLLRFNRARPFKKIIA